MSCLKQVSYLGQSKINSSNDKSVQCRNGCYSCVVVLPNPCSSDLNSNTYAVISDRQTDGRSNVWTARIDYLHVPFLFIHPR